MIFIATAENLTLEDKEEMNVKFDLLMQKSKQLEELLDYHASKANKYYHQALNPLFYFKKE
ncbi:hypothetical protein HYX19_05270 [Candidatus Woesearchaeota archaeon]|nr:hypothetical protein [Candidatus Woesearchaeota archaeon]